MLEWKWNDRDKQEIMKGQVLVIMGLLLSILVNAQPDARRYKKPIFNQIDTFFNVKYGSAPQWYFPYPHQDLYMDIFMPSASVDTHTRRPLIIFAHSGGFLTGSKDVDEMYALCDSFARRGFVTATIEYRKGFMPWSGCSAERAVYRAIQDAKAAIRFFKFFASTYGIDTTKIFFGGTSAGGYMALHSAYVDKESERPACSYAQLLAPDLGCLDCEGNNYPNSSDIFAALDYWGALGDTMFMETPNDPSVLIMHSPFDDVVPFLYDHPFGLPTLPKTFGGYYVAQRASNVGIDHELVVSFRQLHMLDGSSNGTWTANSPNNFWTDTMLPFTTRFIYERIKPITSQIHPLDTVYLCEDEYLVSFQVQGSPLSQFWWFYDTSEVTVIYDNHDSLLILKIDSPGLHEIYVIEFNELLCAGDTVRFYVRKYANPVISGLSTFDSTVLCGTPSTLSISVSGDSSLLYHWFWDNTAISHLLGNSIGLLFLDTGFSQISVFAFDSATGCYSDTLSATIIVAPIPEPVPVEDSVLLCGEEQTYVLEVDVGMGSSIIWLPESSMVGALPDTPIIGGSLLNVSMDSFGIFTYGAVEVSQWGCVSDTVYMTILRPERIIVRAVASVMGNAVNLTISGSGYDSIVWEFDNGMFVINNDSVTIWLPDTLPHTVTLHAFNDEGCYAYDVIIVQASYVMSSETPDHIGLLTMEDNYLKLWVNGSGRIKRVEVIDMSGRKVTVVEDIGEPAIIDMSSWSRGVYMISVYDESGKVYSRRFLK
ncbi:MAG: carboxylesterase family protein [Chlorobi bacterium]|nr:carboxylesterase family protein [Chlorobiota bacterium]